jgi:hypothetical protein
VKWLHPFLETISDDDVIVSLNYDCFLEGFLDFHEAWSPKDGYLHIDATPWGDSLPDNQRNIRILKIHGSESFRRSAFYDKPESVTIDLKINEQLFPRSGKNIHFGCNPDHGAYIIAPSFIKQFDLELQFLLVDAIRFAEHATNLIIIGCGLRPEDSYLGLVLSSFMNTKSWKKKRIFMVSPNASDAKQKYKKFWGREIFTERSLVAIDSGFESGLPRLNDALRQP